MNFKFFVFSIFIAFQSQAAEFLFYPLSSETRYQRNQDQVMMLRPYSVLAAGVDFAKFSFLLERSYNEETYGNAPLVTTHQQTSYSLLARYLIFENSRSANGENTRDSKGGNNSDNRSNNKVAFQILPSVGFGLHQDRSVTRLYASESADNSSWEPLAMAGIVARGRFHFLILELEGRIFSGKLLDPTFSTGGVLRLGFIY